MNAIADPIELLEAECEAIGWYGAAEPPLEDDADDDETIDFACSQRVLDWTVERICACPPYRRHPEA